MRDLLLGSAREAFTDSMALVAAISTVIALAAGALVSRYLRTLPRAP
jgi:hypothetical protein